MKETINKNILHENALNDYFIKYVYSHESINTFAAKNGYIPLLGPALGCEPDVDEIISRQFSEKKIVPFHLRLRRLDIGYGGDHSYGRDSNFLEWYDFLREANTKYPEIQFIALGRLQEKPLEILRLPNVTSLRIYGMGLGHELTLMLRSDLFIGTSSGFAAFANFSEIPYFITKMNSGSCHAYAIPDGAEKLPFAKENQKLIYTEETSSLLMNLLQTGLALPEKHAYPAKANTSQAQQVNISDWFKINSKAMNSSRTTSRFYIDEKYRCEETAYLLIPHLESARKAFIGDERENAKATLQKLQINFPDLCNKFPPYLLLQGAIAAEEKNVALIRACLSKLDIFILDNSWKQIMQLLRASLDTSTTIHHLKTHIGQFNFEANML